MAMGKKTKVWAGVLGVALAASVALNWAGAQGRAGFVEGGVSFEGGGVGQALIGDAPVRTSAPTVPSANPRLEARRRTIVATVAPDTWAEVGGDRSIVAIDDLDLLVVSQTESNHRDIQALHITVHRRTALTCDTCCAFLLPTSTCRARSSASATLLRHPTCTLRFPIPTSQTRSASSRRSPPASRTIDRCAGSPLPARSSCR